MAMEMSGEEHYQSILDTREALNRQHEEKQRYNVSAMVWELYRDKVLTSFQTKEILVCLGFTVVYDSKNEHLVSFR